MQYNCCILESNEDTEEIDIESLFTTQKYGYLHP